MIKNNTIAISSIIIKAAGYSFDTYCDMDEMENEVTTINNVGDGYEVIRKYIEDNIFGGAPVKMWEKTLLDGTLKIVAESGCMSPNAEYDKVKEYMEQL